MAPVTACRMCHYCNRSLVSFDNGDWLDGQGERDCPERKVGVPHDAIEVPMYGESDEGSWIVHNHGIRQDAVTWGPFANRAAVLEFVAKTGGWGSRYAVNTTDHPDWFGVNV